MSVHKVMPLKTKLWHVEVHDSVAASLGIESADNENGVIAVRLRERDDLWIIHEVARRLGHDWGEASAEAVWNEVRRVSPVPKVRKANRVSKANRVFKVFRVFKVQPD